LASHNTAEDKSDHHRGQYDARIGGALAKHALGEERQVEDGHEHTCADQEHRHDRDQEDAVFEELGSDDRLGCAHLNQNEDDQHHRRDDEKTNDLPGTPGVLGTGPGKSQQQGNGACDQGDHAQVVNTMLPAVDELRHHEPGRQDGDGTHGHIHIKDPAPAPVIGDPAAQRWPNDRGQAEGGKDQALPFPALSRRKDIDDDGLGDGYQRSCSQSLDAPVDDQLGHVLAGTSQRRAGEEDDHATEEDDAPSIDVGELAPDGNRDCRGEQVGRDDPGVVLEAAQAGDFPKSLTKWDIVGILDG